MQERSKGTVRRIIDAAAALLKDRGYDGVSTNRIAAAAGISPGSLYQYFPNKDAILEALVVEYTQDLAERASANLLSTLRRDPPFVFAEIVTSHVDAILERPEILRVISGQLPGYCTADVLQPIERRVSDLIRGYTATLRDRPSDMDVDAATWIIVQLLGVSIRYVVDEPPIAKDVFVNEMTRFVLGHPIAQASGRKLAPCCTHQAAEFPLLIACGLE
jgi:AcrR family transcriptional regulator